MKRATAETGSEGSSNLPARHAKEVDSGERFTFGENWSRFLATLNQAKIDKAQESLRLMLRTVSLGGKTFLDVGSGSGLFSLSARQLGAVVHSFDFDPKSVACTAELRRRYFENDPHWIVEEGSALDMEYLRRLGKFDVVYSWGVLHHTGNMLGAFENVHPLVAPGGQLFVAIYNDQGFISRYWTLVKRAYNNNTFAKYLIIGIHAPYLIGMRWLVRRITGRGAIERGMTLWYDMLDWLGGYPFEVARPEKVFGFFRDRGFVLEELRTCRGRMGCNEFVFRLARPPNS